MAVSHSMPRRTCGSSPPPGIRCSSALISAVSSAIGQERSVEKPQCPGGQANASKGTSC